MKNIRKINIIVILAVLLGIFFQGDSFAWDITITISTGPGMNEGVKNETGGWLTKEAYVYIIQAVGGTKYPPSKTPPYYLGGTDFFVNSIEVGAGFPVDEKGRFSFACGVPRSGTPVNAKIYARAFNRSSIPASTYYGDSELFWVSSEVEDIMGEWNINGSDNVPAFSIEASIDFSPPGPPYNFTATPDANGDIILTWTNTTDADLSNVEIRYRTNGVFPSRETEGTFEAKPSCTPGSTTSIRHSGLTDGAAYYYSAFSVDPSNNYSTAYATAFATSHDSMPPHVVSDSHPENVPAMTVGVQFSEVMSQASATSAFSIWPGVTSKSFHWTGNWMYCDLSGTQYNTTYHCTEDVGATDLAGNNLSSTYEFSFTTGAPPADTSAPRIYDFKINGRSVFNGDIISPRPRVTATITDEDGANTIGSIELWANDQLEYSGTPGPAFNTVTGSFEYGLTPSQALAKGSYHVKILAWDLAKNITEESRTGLRVYRDVGIDGPVLNYPNPFSPLKKRQGTTIACNCKSDFDVTLYIYDVTGHVIWRKSFPAWAEGGHAGYNEVYWDGKTSFGEYAPNGMYVLKLVGGRKVLGVSKLTALD